MSKFLESSDDKDEAWAKASAYAVLLTNDPKFKGWMVSVSEIKTRTGRAFGVFLFPPDGD